MSGVVNRQAARQGVNAELTSGENVADVAGLQIAHMTLVRSPSYLGSDASRTELDQLFFKRWATVWACKMTADEAKRKLRVDAHAPAHTRCNMAVGSVSQFYDAFGVGPHDAMYIHPADRAVMWFA